MEKEKAKNKISTFYFNVVLVIVMVAMLVVVTFSWYTTKRENKVDLIRISSASNGELFIVDGDELTDCKRFNFSDVNLVPTYGDGDTFFAPSDFDLEGKSIMINGVKMFMPVATEFAEEDEEEIDDKILSYDFTLYSTCSDGSIIINPKTKAMPGENNKYSLAAVGCLRVAIYEKDANSGDFIKKCIWVPNPQYEISYNEELGINTLGNVEDYYVFKHSEGSTKVIPNAVSGKKTDGGVDYIWGDFPENYKLSEIVLGQKIDYKIVMWLDGEDRECVPSLLGTVEEVNGENVIVNGKISLSLVLDFSEVD